MADQTTAASATADDFSTEVSDGRDPSSTSTLKPLFAELSDKNSVFDPLAALGREEETDETTDDTERSDGTDGAAEADVQPADESADSAEAQTTDPEAEEMRKEIDAATQEGTKPRTLKRMQRMLERYNAALAKEREADAKAAEAEAKISEMQSKLDEATHAKQDQPVPVKVDNDPLAAVTNEEQLDATEVNAQAWRRWCIRNLNGGTPPVQGAEDMSADEVADALERAEDTLAAIPKRREFLAKFQANRAEARKAHPEMFRAGTPEHAAHGSWQKRLLNFATAADQDTIIAKLLKVERMEAEEKAGIAKYQRVAVPKPGSAATPAGAAATSAAQPKPKAPTPAPPSVPQVRQGNGSDKRSALLSSKQQFDPLDLVGA